jgi:hypothetical protein
MRARVRKALPAGDRAGSVVIGRRLISRAKPRCAENGIAATQCVALWGQGRPWPPRLRPRPWRRHGHRAAVALGSPKGPTPRHNELRQVPVTMPQPAASQPRPIWSADGDALDRAAAATAASSTAAPCPGLSTHCITVVLSTLANHNYPADRLQGARVAALCTPPSNLMQNQDVQVFAHYAINTTGPVDRLLETCWRTLAPLTEIECETMSIEFPYITTESAMAFSPGDRYDCVSGQHVGGDQIRRKPTTFPTTVVTQSPKR